MWPCGTLRDDDPNALLSRLYMDLLYIFVSPLHGSSIYICLASTWIFYIYLSRLYMDLIVLDLIIIHVGPVGVTSVLVISPPPSSGSFVTST